MKRTFIVMLSIALTACGASSAPASHQGPEEVTATWTSGDDAPLGGDASTQSGDQPGGPKT